MRQPKTSLELDVEFLEDSVEGLAADVVQLDEDVEWLSEWTKNFCENFYNPLLWTIDHNFEVLERRINKLKRWATGSFICIILLAIAIILKSVGL